MDTEGRSCSRRRSRSSVVGYLKAPTTASNIARSMQRLRLWRIRPLRVRSGIQRLGPEAVLRKMLESPPRGWQPRTELRGAAEPASGARARGLRRVRRLCRSLLRCSAGLFQRLAVALPGVLPGLPRRGALSS